MAIETMKKVFTLRFQFTVLALFASVLPALAQPTLSIAPTNNQLILFWPANANGTNGVLESTSDLTSPNWIASADAVPANYGSQTAVAVTYIASARFFRLVLVPPTADGMALIPSGWFTMGNQILDGNSITNDADITDAGPTNVYVSAFYMDTNLVSYSQWQTVYNYARSQGYLFDYAGSAQTVAQSVQPVQTVNWYDCLKWCNARSQMAGLVPVYYTDAAFAQLYTNMEVRPYVNWSANGYRLPTEAEWEKAARGGLSGHRFPWGNTISLSQANYYSVSNSLWPYDMGPYVGFNPAFVYAQEPYTSPVGYFAANGYGLYDMAGNVDEWCWDWYGTPYGQPTTNNPTGPSSGSNVVLRGGIWGGSANLLRCASRRLSGVFFFTSSFYDGFRCVRRP
jgi:formylglycine-generating enzyme required for sulfatase activity